jgi:peptidoglycan L-alanyl-D-glutamate endopeptidase CwlK
MASRLITDLKNIAGIACAEHIDRVHAEKINMIITCTLRSNEEQESLWKSCHKIVKGKIIDLPPISTNARAGQSPHNHGLAWDIALLIDGKLNWNVKHPHWIKAVEIGRSIKNVKWGGDFTGKFKDRPHFEIKDWKDYIK